VQEDLNTKQLLEKQNMLEDVKISISHSSLLKIIGRLTFFQSWNKNLLNGRCRT
jgi:hypothetical protein